MSAMDDVTVFAPDDDETLDALRRDGAAAVVGAGGPFQRHALAASLDQALGQRAPSGWRILEVQSDRAPFWSLASALLADADTGRAAATLVGAGTDLPPARRISHLAERLESEPSLLGDLLRRMEPRGIHTLVLLDPFDWDATPGENNIARNSLVARLLVASKRPENRLSVLFSLSESQKAQCRAMPGLMKVVERPAAHAAFSAPPPAMDVAHLFGSAALGQGAVAADLQREAARLDAAALDLGDNIAVLEDAVRPDELGAADAQQAEAFYQRLDPQRQRLLERIMRAITYCGLGTRGLVFESRPRAWKTLQRWLSPEDRAAAEPLLESLISPACRIVSHSGTYPRIGLASAELLDTWPRLRQWAREERGLRKAFESACKAYRQAVAADAGRPAAVGDAHRLLEQLEVTDSHRRPYRQWARRYEAQPWFEQPATVAGFLSARAGSGGVAARPAASAAGKDSAADLLLAGAVGIGLIGLAVGLYLAVMGENGPVLIKLPFGQ